MKNRIRKCRKISTPDGRISWYVGNGQVVIWTPAGQRLAVGTAEFAALAPEVPTSWNDPHSLPNAVTPGKVVWWVEKFSLQNIQSV